MSNLIKHKEDVYTLSDFLDKDECEKIIKYLEFLVESKMLIWNQISFYESYAMGFWERDNNLKMFGLDPEYFRQLKERIKEKSEEVLGRKLTEVSYHAQKWTEGAFATFHSDNSDEDGNPTPFIRSKYAVFLYLNEEFTGGKLNFKNDDITIVPKLGMLSIFDGGHGNEHEVTQVLSGTRYTIGSFWDKAESVYTPEQEAMWAKDLAEIRKGQDELYKVWAEERAQGYVPKHIGKGE